MEQDLEVTNAAEADVITDRSVGLTLRIKKGFPFRVMLGTYGLICVGVRGTGGPGLVLVMEEGGLNTGERAKTVMPELLTFLKLRWSGEMDLLKASIVVSDETGKWDAALPTWKDSGEAAEVRYEGLMSNSAECATSWAFVCVHAGMAHRAIHAVGMLRARRG